MAVSVKDFLDAIRGRYQDEANKVEVTGSEFDKIEYIEIYGESKRDTSTVDITIPTSLSKKFNDFELFFQYLDNFDSGFKVEVRTPWGGMRYIDLDNNYVPLDYIFPEAFGAGRPVPLSLAQTSTEVVDPNQWKMYLGQEISVRLKDFTKTPTRGVLKVFFKGMKA